MRYDSQASVSGVDCSTGAGVLFHGSLWHGSFNDRGGARRALLLQYARHGIPARLVKDRTVYPPILDDESLPSVLPLRGKHDPLTNYNLMALGDGVVYPSARLARRPLLLNAELQSWKRFFYFKTSTPVSNVMICHASELMPGCMPHLPHAHTREELLVVLRGNATIFSQDGNGGVLRSIPAGPGDLFYYPKGHAHTILNSGEDPLHYLMFRWTARAAESMDAKAFHYRHADYSSHAERFSVDRDSSRLHHLHIHFTRLAPSEAFPSHIDLYDTGIVVLKGMLSMLDEELGPGGVFFVRSGELHNTRNESSETCEYIVFEFHARVGEI
jgi:mannose-6-phosphate isomerase-like protein (cupin superfamily)